MIKKLILFCLFLFTVSTLEAYVPECPYFSTKKSCLDAVEKEYQNNFNDINENYWEDSIPILIDAAVDMRQLEARACERTCYN